MDLVEHTTNPNDMINYYYNYFLEFKLKIPDIIGIDQKIIGNRASGIAAIGKSYISSFIIADTMNQTTTGEHNTTANLS